MSTKDESKKRSEAAKKAAATRKANAEAAEQQGNEPQTGGVKYKRKLGAIGESDVERQDHSADVNPGDQQAQHEQQQKELDAAREEHALRTAGRRIGKHIRTAGRRIGKGAKTTNPTTTGRARVEQDQEETQRAAKKW